ncbi:hypothetical protein BLL42_27525 (plasmid) [Pseudomonas frederiksbergensis]|uniref:Uncharacterized protein n=1 Tax=Pseudomonas frederiksbergensis TaxID=104087 RepID=A0A1J0EUI1_9PSED|nr:hypothetical protein BLL42_27525 [Pseudomonas frederiksbergensis]
MQANRRAGRNGGVYSSGVYIVRWYKQVSDELRNKGLHIVSNECLRLTAGLPIAVLAKEVSVENLLAFPMNLSLQVHPQETASTRGLILAAFQ